MPVNVLFRSSLLAAAVSSASMAQAASVEALFAKYDLIGTQAWDCNRPASADNWHYINRLLDGDRVQRDLMLGPTTRQWRAIFDKAAELKPNEIVVNGRLSGRIEGRVVENEPVDGVWRIE